MGSQFFFCYDYMISFRYQFWYMKKATGAVTKTLLMSFARNSKCYTSFP